MAEFRLRLALQFGDDALRQHLTKLDTPLIEWIDLPDSALGKNHVLVQRHEFAQHFGSQSLCKDHVRRPVALEHAVGREPFGCAFGLDLLRESCRRPVPPLRENICYQHVVVTADRVQRLARTR